MKATSFQMVIDGVELHWTEQGAGSPLIVLHGLADSQHTWAAVSAELGRRYRVLCLDLPGCGLSGRPDATYSLDWQARIAVAWLDRLGLRSYDVLGHSYGGGVALWLLLYRSPAVRKLALVSPGGLGSEVTLLLRLAAVFGGLEAAAEFVIGPVTRLLLYLHGCSLPVEQRRMLCRLNARPGTARAFARTVRDVMNWRGQTRHLLDRVHHIERLPSLGLFWGEQDRVIPIHHGRALCEALENCSLWPLPGGHFLHWQAPRALAHAVLAFLDRREPCAHNSGLDRRGISVRHSDERGRLSSLSMPRGPHLRAGQLAQRAR
jgi:pimeloyl-ACP methyl ester carboxylesterase